MNCEEVVVVYTYSFCDDVNGNEECLGRDIDLMDFHFTSFHFSSQSLNMINLCRTMSRPENVTLL